MGHPGVVERLLAAGANIEAALANGKTPLSVASLAGHLPVMRVLLDAGADIDTRDKEGWPPLLCAASNGHVVRNTAISWDKHRLTKKRWCNSVVCGMRAQKDMLKWWRDC